MSPDTQNALKNKIAALEQEIEQLKKHKLFFDAILDNAPALISAKDLHGTVILTNKRFNCLQGPSAEEFVGKNVFELFPKEIARQLWENDLKAQRSKKPVEVEEEVYHKDGTPHTYYTVKFPLEHDGELFATCAFSVDITHLKQVEQERNTDYLTGLYNRRLLEETVAKELSRATNRKAYLGFMIIDLDHFKQVNDEFGHTSGDQVLVKLAEILMDTFKRRGDAIFRVGGEEFVVIFSAQSQGSAEQVAHDLKQRVFDAALKHPNNQARERVTVSIGLKVISPEEQIEFINAYKQADKALYLAKKSGRNRVCISTLT